MLNLLRALSGFRRINFASCKHTHTLPETSLHQRTHKSVRFAGPCVRRLTAASRMPCFYICILCEAPARGTPWARLTWTPQMWGEAFDRTLNSFSSSEMSLDLKSWGCLCVVCPLSWWGDTAVPNVGSVKMKGERRRARKELLKKLREASELEAQRAPI